MTAGGADGLADAARISAEGRQDVTTLKLVVIGGSACPPAMIRAFEDDYGIEVRHAWGMTEMSPIGSTGSIKPSVADLPREELLALKAKQGWAPFGVEMKIVDDDEPRTAVGRQALRPPQGRGLRRRRAPISRARAATSSTRTASSTPATSRPSIPTATCRSPTAPRTSSSRAASGFPRSTSRISRSAIPTSPEAAVIGVAHPKWDERPLLIVVPKEGKTPQRRGRARLPAEPHRQMVDARRHADGEGNPPHRDRQDQQAEAARGVQGLQAADGVSRALAGGRLSARTSRRGAFSLRGRRLIDPARSGIPGCWGKIPRGCRAGSAADR